MHVVLIILAYLIELSTMKTKQPCKSWPSYGLCPYQPVPAHIGTVFDATVDENCMDKDGKKRFIPCKFSADYSCIVVFFDRDYILAGCISDSGVKLIKEPSLENDTEKVGVENIDLYTINRKCLNTPGCARAKVSRLGSRSVMMLEACCCKSEHCVNLDAYVHAVTNATALTDAVF
ncbi:unnamed protein product [Cylicocyclus nassatus]|uniref:Uncharacterized protein n=1 Tax=Cylicocyclus nassatus TaxID=53992 RepID=A0AA36MCA9_CYLNA|nr:unnamed protein product [Cylicocyclus nassatus]